MILYLMDVYFTDYGDKPATIVRIEVWATDDGDAFRQLYQRVNANMVAEARIAMAE